MCVIELFFIASLTPAHQWVEDAIVTMKEVGGSSRNAIAKWIEDTHSVPKEQVRAVVYTALIKGVNAGKIVANKSRFQVAGDLASSSADDSAAVAPKVKKVTAKKAAAAAAAAAATAAAAAAVAAAASQVQ